MGKRQLTKIELNGAKNSFLYFSDPPCMNNEEQLATSLRDLANKQVLLVTLLMKYDAKLATFFVETLSELIQHPHLPQHTRHSAQELLVLINSCLKKPTSPTNNSSSVDNEKIPPLDKKHRPDWLQFVIEDGKVLDKK